MLQAATIAFLTDLAANNNKTWFDANRDRYAAAKEDYEKVVTDILSGLAKTDAGYSELKAKDCIFRIFRDVRFGKDKTPYKPNFGAAFGKGGKKTSAPGFYLHIEPGRKSFIGGGLWMPEAPLLKKVRQEIDYNLDEFRGIVTGQQFKTLFPEIQGERLKKIPEGYEADNPAMEYLKLKSFVVGHNMINDADLTSKKMVEKVLNTFATMQPFISFLTRAVEA
jgi:uncharacterized protein (TIGR02453 family)